jgi:hypothetical protein
VTDARDGNVEKTAFILVDADPLAGPSVDSSTGTRLAAQLLTSPIYAWDPNADAWDPAARRTLNETGEELFLMGRMRTFHLSMDLPVGQAQDAWERAARLIHSRYAATAPAGESTKPWDELDIFYKKSNHRLVLNTLWTVKTKGEHTWDTWGSMTESAASTKFAGMTPKEQLRALGFTDKAAMEMAEFEHRSWYSYLVDNGWRFGEPRNEKKKINPGLMEWDAEGADVKVHAPTLERVADTLIALRQLGYQSRPAWRRYRRTGTVIARQRHEPWTWKSDGGGELQAEAGDWEVSDGEGAKWSVNRQLFTESYVHVHGDKWERTGMVLARRALDGEIVETLEGRQQVTADVWIVKGGRGEQWPVTRADFEKNYEGPLPAVEN